MADGSGYTGARQAGDRRLNVEDTNERMLPLVSSLEKEAQNRVTRRSSVEDRWIEDLRQYHGIYDDATLDRIKKKHSSEVFINTTATKTDAMEARLCDLLFPTDDQNWGISPTPVPELTEGAEAELDKAEQAEKRMNEAEASMQQQVALTPEGEEPGPEAQQAEQAMRQSEDEMNAALDAAAELQDQLDEARRRNDLMEKEIADQLAACQWPKEARDIIRDACKLGTGVMKGPIIGERHNQRWRREQVQDPETGEVREGEFALASEQDGSPGLIRVDPWAFFPDPDAARPEDSEGFFERHLMTKQQLRKLARRSDMNKDMIRSLLESGPKGGGTPAYMSNLLAITGQTDGQYNDRYVVWEYSGPLEKEQMIELADAFDDTDLAEDMSDMDPLEEINAKVWFCQGHILSFALHPLDSGEPIYSVYNIRADETSMWGFGIPYIMRHPQAVMNGAFRMMMDNSGFSTGPQIVVNKDAVSPQDGDWTVKSGKIWVRKNGDMGTGPGNRPFESFDIPSNQQELANIITIAQQVTDEVTAMPAIAQGEQGTDVTKTAQGMALLMNSANVTFRRVVKNYDDDITVPGIRRLYHWNMQFSEKEEIKGDYEVQARGSSVLLVREMQAQNLLMIANIFGDHPIYGPMLKHGDLLRQIFKAHMIAVDEIVLSERDYKKKQAEQAEQPDPETAARQMEIELKQQELAQKERDTQAKIEIANMESDARMRVAQLNYEATMNQVAEKLNMQREELDAKLAEADRKAQSDERQLATEVAMKERTGQSSGGAI